MGEAYRQRAVGTAAPMVRTTPVTAPVSIGIFMDRLERRGVTFALVADGLQVTVPSGALSEAERHELVARRDEVARLVRVALAWLHSPATIAGEIASLEAAQREGDRSEATGVRLADWRAVQQAQGRIVGGESQEPLPWSR